MALRLELLWRRERNAEGVVSQRDPFGIRLAVSLSHQGSILGRRLKLVQPDRCSALQRNTFASFRNFHVLHSGRELALAPTGTTTRENYARATASGQAKSGQSSTITVISCAPIPRLPGSRELVSQGMPFLCTRIHRDQVAVQRAGRTTFWAGICGLRPNCCLWFWRSALSIRKGEAPRDPRRLLLSKVAAEAPEKVLVQRFLRSVVSTRRGRQRCRVSQRPAVTPEW